MKAPIQEKKKISKKNVEKCELFFLSLLPSTSLKDNKKRKGRAPLLWFSFSFYLFQFEGFSMYNYECLGFHSIHRDQYLSKELGHTDTWTVKSVERVLSSDG